MCIESIEAQQQDTFDTVTNDTYSDNSLWNGREIYSKVHHKKDLYISLIVDKILSQPKPVTCGAIQEYFDPEQKKAQEFEINVLLHAVHCSTQSEFDEKFKKLKTEADKLLFETGCILAAIFCRDFKSALFSSAAIVYLFKDNKFVTWNEFIQMVKNRDNTYEEVFFYTIWEEYQKNQQELISKGIILEGFDQYHYTENPHYQGQLDPTFNPWSIT